MSSMDHHSKNIQSNTHDKYNELLNFGIEVENIFMTCSCDISDSERFLIIMN